MAMVSEQQNSLRVFISSTYEDLIPYRAAVTSAITSIEHLPLGMEQFISSPESSLSYCLAEVEKSDVFIVVVAMSYGSVDKKTGKSYTELEYEKAVENDIPILAFILDDTEQPILARFVDNGKKALRLQQFKKKLDEHMTQRFTTPDNLKELVVRSLTVQIKRMAEFNVSMPNNLTDENGVHDRHALDDLQSGIERYVKATKDTSSVFLSNILNESPLGSIPLILKTITDEGYCKSIIRRYTITPSENGESFTQEIYSEYDLVTASNRTKLMTKSWFESTENRRDATFESILVDGINKTDEFIAQLMLIERDKFYFNSPYGIDYPYIILDNNVHEHKIAIKANAVKRFSEPFYQISETNRWFCNRYSCSIVISGKYAYKWKLRCSGFCNFYATDSLIQNDYATRKLTEQSYQIDFNNWVFPGAGFIYTLYPNIDEK